MTCCIRLWLIGMFSVSINFGLFSLAEIVVGPVGLLAQETTRTVETLPELTGKIIEAEDTQACNPYYPSDPGTTIFQSLSIDSRSIIKDRETRPMHASEREPLAPLFTGAVS